MAYPYHTPAHVPHFMYQVFGNATENAATMVTIEADEKYKTELCKNWVQYGHCSYGNKCRFAHGPEDLVSKQVFNPKYKSKRCEGFHATFYCPYGGRCNFIHDDGNSYKQRVLYYTYLLDLQTKFCVVKYALMKYLGQAFAAYANMGPFAPQSPDTLLENFVSYIKNGEYFKRLPVLVQQSSAQSVPSATATAVADDEETNEETAENAATAPAAKFIEDRLKAILKELLGKFMQDYLYYRLEKEYWDSLGIFLSTLLALHPELKVLDYFGLKEHEAAYAKLLENLYDSLIVQPAEAVKQLVGKKDGEDDEVEFAKDGLNEIIMKDNYYYSDDTETMADEEPGVDVFSVNWSPQE